MNSKSLQLVTFEQAKRLHRLGFNYPVPSYYYGDAIRPKERGRLCIRERSDLRGFKGWKNWKDWQPTANDIRYAAPTVALALKWMRDVKHVPCGVYPRSFWNSELDMADLEPAEYHACGKVLDRVIDIARDTYEAAESALLDELLNLI